jgi:hypothetical protein
MMVCDGNNCSLERTDYIGGFGLYRAGGYDSLVEAFGIDEALYNERRPIKRRSSVRDVTEQGAPAARKHRV